MTVAQGYVERLHCSVVDPAAHAQAAQRAVGQDAGSAGQVQHVAHVERIGVSAALYVEDRVDQVELAVVAPDVDSVIARTGVDRSGTDDLLHPNVVAAGSRAQLHGADVGVSDRECVIAAAKRNVDVFESIERYRTRHALRSDEFIGIERGNDAGRVGSIGNEQPVDAGVGSAACDDRRFVPGNRVHLVAHHREIGDEGRLAVGPEELVSVLSLGLRVVQIAVAIEDGRVRELVVSVLDEGHVLHEHESQIVDLGDVKSIARRLRDVVAMGVAPEIEVRLDVGQRMGRIAYGEVVVARAAVDGRIARY